MTHNSKTAALRLLMVLPPQFVWWTCLSSNKQSDLCRPLYNKQWCSINREHHLARHPTIL